MSDTVSPPSLSPLMSPLHQAPQTVESKESVFRVGLQLGCPSLQIRGFRWTQQLLDPRAPLGLSPDLKLADSHKLSLHRTDPAARHAGLPWKETRLLGSWAPRMEAERKNRADNPISHCLAATPLLTGCRAPKRRTWPGLLLAWGADGNHWVRRNVRAKSWTGWWWRRLCDMALGEPPERRRCWTSGPGGHQRAFGAQPTYPRRPAGAGTSSRRTCAPTPASSSPKGKAEGALPPSPGGRTPRWSSATASMPGAGSSTKHQK